MKIVHTITATVNPADTRSDADKAAGVRYASLPRVEKTYRLTRTRKLTLRGAQRILRAQHRARHEAHGNLIATRIETMIASS